jgi:hypothetical protein
MAELSLVLAGAAEKDDEWSRLSTLASETTPQARSERRETARGRKRPCLVGRLAAFTDATLTRS